MSDIKYKKGDKVRIKSIDWYNENKDMNGNVFCGCEQIFNTCTALHCGQVFTIKHINCLGWYEVEEEDVFIKNEMIEGLVEEEKPLCECCCNSLELKFDKLTIADNICSDKVEIILQDYELKQEGDKWFAVKKKKEYPKTYDECAKLLNTYYGSIVGGYNWKLLSHFQQLLICRDAYWEIAGEEMGLDRQWEPQFQNCNILHYCIFVNNMGNIHKYSFYASKCLLAFPTEEMRDAFYENFKDLIEKCKELL